MKFTVTLCDSDNVCVRKFIGCVKKTKPDCTIVQGDVKVKAHKILLQTFSDTYTDEVFDDSDNTVIVLFNQSPYAIKKVITELLYDAKVVVDNEQFGAIHRLCDNLGIKIDWMSWESIDSEILLHSPPKEVLKRRLSLASNKALKSASPKSHREFATPVSSRIRAEKRRNTVASKSFQADNSETEATPIQSPAKNIVKKRRISRSKSCAPAPAAKAAKTATSQRAPSSKRVPVLPARYRDEFVTGHVKLTHNKGR